jgi:hypothetical protein
MSARLLAWWERYGTIVLWTAVACMAAAAAWRLSNELPRLLSGADGAFDMRLRHREVHRWFADEPVYGDVERGDYPPASYVILWPLLGWLDLAAARVLWAVTGLAGLAWLAWLAVREGGARTAAPVLLLALLPFSVYPSSATLAMGQLMNHVLPAILAALLLLRRRPPRWSRDVAAAGLMIAALVKPPIAVPFFLIMLLVPDRVRPAVLVIGGYAAVTLLAAAFRSEPLPYTLFGWLAETPQVLDGHSNVHKWLALAGLQQLMLPASLGILLWLAWWIRRYREVDVWLLLGVCGIVAQLWLHHRLYDHLLLVVPMIALFRIAAGDSDGNARIPAALFFAAVWGTLHMPAGLLTAPPPLSLATEAAQTLVWIAALVYLLHCARSSVRISGRRVSSEAGGVEAMQSQSAPTLG